MDDLRSLVIGIVGGLIVVILVWAFRAYRRKSIADDIAFLEFEKEHLEAMKRSGVEMSRSSFRAIFTLLFIFGLTNLIPRLISHVGEGLLTSVSSFLSLTLWALFVALCYRFWQRYDNLKNYKAAIARIDAKLQKLQTQLEKS